MLKIAGELSETAHACTEIQWLISSLLERAHHPDLPAELHMLQDIDRLQQTLADIAALIEVMARPAQGIDVAKADLNASLKLESLRMRLLDQDEGPGQEKAARNETAGITWL